MHLQLNDVLQTRVTSKYGEHAPRGLAVSFKSPAPSSIIVSVSDDAKRLSQGVDSPQRKSHPEEIEELKAFIRGIDFSHATPDQMLQMACRLAQSGELTTAQVDGFMGIEFDKQEPISSSQALDIDKHFQEMLEAVTTAARTDASMAFGVKWRQASIDTFAAVREFAYSDTPHVFGRDSNEKAQQ